VFPKKAQILLNRMGKFLTLFFIFCLVLVGNAQYSYTNQSALRAGEWYRVGVLEDGVYSILPSDLSQLGAGSSVPIQSIRVYGNGGTMLPEKNGDSNPDDMVENPVKVYDTNGDGIFNGSDYIIFYGKGPGEWIHEVSAKRFVYRRNIYVDTAYYFISVNNGTSLPLVDVPSQSGTPDYNVTSWDDFAIIENDSLNLMNSGRKWFWKDFKYVISHNVSGSIAAGIIPDSLTKARVWIAARCVGCVSSYNVSVGGQSLGSLSVGSASISVAFAEDGQKTFLFNTSNPNFSFTVNRVSPLGQGLDAWLDFIEVNARRYTNRVGAQLQFTDKYTLGKTLAAYSIGSASGTSVWEITNQQAPRNILHSNGSFSLPGDVLRRFIVFENANFKRPVVLGKVKNQNLHALGYADNIVVTHPLFYEQAKRLADFHLSTEGITYHLVTVDDIYNEFSSGMQDPTAIRNFIRMFWQRQTDGIMAMPKYLTLFGDASYDPKTHLNRSYKDSSGVRININSNFVPGWQTSDSYSQGGGTFTTDDYFGIMAMGRGGDNGVYRSDYVKIGIGRLLVRTPAEAEATVSKIIRYASSEDCVGDWRNRMLLMADDEDTPSPDVTFVPYNEHLSTIMKNQFPVYNVDKLYLDAYDQVVTAGQRYPDAEKALADKINKGLLLINYIGHGGEKGLTKERLMQIDDVDKWDTYNKLPLWITATCTFTRYDDPHFVSAGEYILMKPDGGGVALISTSRPISPNSSESQSYIKATFTPDSAGDMPRLGDIMRVAKNDASGQYAPLLLLFGDPALRLAYPKNNVVTQSITDINGGPIDTLKATQIVKITGSVMDQDGFLMGGFNGFVYPTVFDKPSKLRTKQNDPGATLYEFEIQKNIIFKGKAEVINGNFEFTFKVPLDINYTVGLGKISYYAADGIVDAHGYDTVKVGGSENNCLEEDGPQIKLSLNDEWFVSGGVANANPTVYAKLYDESGINLSGAGIGHDLLLTLTGPVNQEYIVNDFYISEAGGYKSGELSYRLRDLPPGEYTLSLRAWDACTNSGTSSITFRVDTSQLVLNNLYNFPNPTNGGTTFSFEHNFAETDLQADLRIHSLQGTLVKQIRQTVNSDGFRSVQLYWDGNSDGGQRLSAGLYIYTLYLTNGKGKAVKASNKLIITE
jgi:hypothetical protein